MEELLKKINELEKRVAALEGQVQAQLKIDISKFIEKLKQLKKLNIL